MKIPALGGGPSSCDGTCDRPIGSECGIVDGSTKQDQRDDYRTDAAAADQINFPVALDVVLPSDVSLQRLPAEAEQLAPQLKGDSYVAVEELVAIVDTNSRKIISVMQRMRAQENTK
jgi:hypothetical protein